MERTREEQDLVRQLLEQLPDAAYVLDWDTGELIYLNKAVQDVTGFAPEEFQMLGREGVYARIHPDDREDYMANIRHLLEQGGRETLAYRWLHKDGRYRWLSDTHTLLPVGEAHTRILMGTLQDVTAQKETEAALREIEAYFRLSSKNFPVIVASLDRELRYIWIYNPHPAFDLEAIIGKRDDEIFAPENVAEFMRFKQSVLDTGSVARREIPIYIPGDGWRYYDVVAEPVRDESGSIVGLTTVSLDITERVRAEQEVQTERARLQTVLDALPVGIYIADPSGRLLLANRAANEIWGHAPLSESLEEYAEHYKAWWPKTGKRLQSHEWGIARAVVHGEVSGPEELEIETEGGQHKIILNYARPVQDESGAILGGVAVNVDITERKQAEEALQESEARLRTILGNLTEGVVLLDAEGVVQHMNDAAREALGRIYSATAGAAQSAREAVQNLMGRSVREPTDPRKDPRHRLVRPDGTPFPVEELPGPKALRTGQAVRNVELGVPQRDGTLGWITVSAQPILDTEGHPHGAVVSFFDITERKQAEETRRESEERFAAIFQVNPTALIFSRVEDGLILDANNAFFELFQWTREEVIGKTSRDLNLFADFQERDRAIALLHRNGRLRDYEIRIRRKSGEERIALLSSELLQVAEGLAFLTIIQDITERKQAEEALRESEERYRALYEQAAVGIKQVSRDGQLQAVNQKMANILGYTREELEGRSLAELTPPEDWQKEQVLLRRLMDGEISSYVLERRYLRKDGQLIWARVTTSLAHGAHLAYGISVVEDITERKQAEEALQETQEKLRALNETLEQQVIERTARLRGLALELTRAEERERRRLAQLLHDHLQQLLAAARISVNMVRNQMKNDHQAEALGQVDALLEESIAESRSLTAELSPPVLYDAGLAPALDWLARWMEEKYDLNVQVQAEELGTEVPEEIRLVLFQGARELLFNVVKHAGVAQAKLELRRLPDEQAELVVSDQGVGVDPSQIGKQQTKGGFGLFNVRERLESMGGRMHIDSAPGEGTRVTLRVPLHPTEAIEEETARNAVMAREEAAIAAEELAVEREEAEQAAAAGMRTVRVLLADDHVIMRQGLARLLEAEPGIELVGQANDGRETVELAHRTHPDVILMDVSMPVMDGIEATRRIVAELPDVRVIGLSMYEGAEVETRMREAGAMGYVSKGGNPVELVGAVRKLAKS